MFREAFHKRRCLKMFCGEMFLQRLQKFYTMAEDWLRLYTTEHPIKIIGAPKSRK
jgi:hypothetical protein